MSHGRDTSPKQYGVVCEFETPEELLTAAKAIREAGYRDMDAYSPMPVHGLTDVLEWKDDRLGWIVFLGGIKGFLLGYGLQIWTAAGGFGTQQEAIKVSSWFQNTGLGSYAHNVGGKPLISTLAFFPPAYELTILFAAFGATFGMHCRFALPAQPTVNSSFFLLYA